ncbi:hypothetical protein [Paenibacillus agilis]|uniref:Uncharacterized protein n=1 Tax=Paenibacillus agilis TaxID=3020863 RepID=A0A559IY39_9BACL|nr:hypothetical protein [Paenibacillus agilis]TVX92545.1 hypothetical protein FPZ44_05435 [Paenibacillus agilis]
MRINSSYKPMQSNQQTSRILSNDKFETSLKEAEQKEEKENEKRGKLVTAREGEYVRQYLVQADGSKILLAEVKQSTAQPNSENKESSETLAATLVNRQGIHTNSNTKSMMNLLNFQAGVGAGTMLFAPTKDLNSIGK